MVSLGEKAMWTSTPAILDTGAGPNFIKQRFAVMACLPSAKQMMAVRLQLACNSHLKVVRTMTGVITRSESSPVAIIDETQRDHMIDISDEKAMEENRSTID